MKKTSAARIPALRARILDQMLRVSAVVAFVPCIAGVLLALRFEIWQVAVLDTLCWIALVVLALDTDRSYASRAGGFLLLLGAAGTGLLVALGPFGVGLIWLLAVPAVTGVLFGPREFWVAEGLVMTVILGAAWGQGVGLLQFGDLPAPLAWWVMAACSVLSVSLLVGLSTAAMMSRLQEALGQVEHANRSLQAEIAGRQKAEAERASLREQVTFAQKMELVGQLAGGVAHDLNNLLTVVRIEGDMARDDVAEGSELAEGLDNLLEATTTASALCGRLLLFARPNAGNRHLVELDRCVERALPLLQSLAGSAVCIDADLRAAGDLVVADPIEIEQILTNLVANARDAMPRGGPLYIRTRSRIDDRGPHVHLEVEDSGVGMDDTVITRVFEPFFSTKVGRGTGLGLATVYSLVRSLDGSVTVDSAVDQGTTFALTLPVASGSPADPELDVPMTRLRLPDQARSAMVVEDNPAVRQVVVRVLEAIGCVVIAEPDALRALSTLDTLTTPLDLVVTDVLMPGLTGVDLAEALQHRSPGTAILAMTGWIGDNELASRLDHLGVPILRKPFSPAELVDAVAERLASEAVSR